MAEATKIEWADSTLNPWIGCTKIAPACDFCYAADWSRRYGRAEWGNHPRERTSSATWNAARKWQAGAAAFYLEHGRRRRVFCASLADVFDNQVPAEWREDLWALIRECPDLNFLMLTKRPQNIKKMLPAFWDEVRGHVWLGTTVEDQAHADANIPYLLQHDSAVRFVSCEPLLGPIDFSRIVPSDHRPGSKYGRNALSQYDYCEECGEDDWLPRIDWVIAGGESGPHARPSSIQWYRALRDQCAATGVPFLFKQWGEWQPAGAVRSGMPGRFAFGDYEHDPSRMILIDHYPRQFTMFGARSVVQRIGKKAAGRLLDGVEHNDFPEVRQ